VERDLRLTTNHPDTVLDDAADIAGVDRQQITLDGAVGHLWLNVVAHPLELPLHGVRNHLNGLRQPDMADGSIADLCPELLLGQPGADLLLKRETANARILNAIHANRVDPLADRGQRNRKRIHRKSGVHSGRKNSHLGLPRGRV
jgi:hypothetical protein